MNVDQNVIAGGGPSVPAAGGEAPRGRVTVRERVYRTVVEQASASLIGVSLSDVKADVVERGAGVSLRISTPLPIPDLDDTVAISQTTPVLDRARELQEQLQQRLTGILGREVSRIALTITGATIPERRRVR
ncbi:hypothetical protein [Microbacterium sp. NPDC089696]|uniref:hypothetical protein n=1 Tax=Microbacterium sp. NPDC089696 TaxID=3364199 RepID=UPI003819A16D